MTNKYAWHIIDVMPKDGALIEVYTPTHKGLPPTIAIVKYDANKGFRLKDLRAPTHWRLHDIPLGAPRSLNSDD